MVYRRLFVPPYTAHDPPLVDARYIDRVLFASRFQHRDATSELPGKFLLAELDFG